MRRHPHAHDAHVGPSATWPLGRGSSATAPRMRVQTAWSEEREAWGSGVGSIDDSDLYQDRLDVCFSRVQRFTKPDEHACRANTLP